MDANLVHIVGATFDTAKILAPLEQIGFERVYVIDESGLHEDRAWRGQAFTEIVRNIGLKDRLTSIKCGHTLESIQRELQKIISAETQRGSRILINISSGSRLFTAATAMLAGAANVELYQVVSRSYYVQRNFNSGIERVELLPRSGTKVEEVTVDSTLAFILMPFSPVLAPVYEDIVKPVLQKAGLRPIRADDLFDNRPIMDEVWQNIERARLLVSDLTGRNPNVFYETGIAHAMGKEVILLTRDLNDVPFDLRHIRCIVYSDSVRGGDALRGQLSKTVEIVLARTTVAPRTGSKNTRTV